MEECLLPQQPRILTEENKEDTRHNANTKIRQRMTDKTRLVDDKFCLTWQRKRAYEPESCTLCIQWNLNTSKRGIILWWWIKTAKDVSLLIDTKSVHNNSKDKDEVLLVAHRPPKPKDLVRAQASLMSTLVSSCMFMVFFSYTVYSLITIPR